MAELDKHTRITGVDFDPEQGHHIAVCHKMQGGAANGWNSPVLLKSEEAVDDAVKEKLESLIKARDEVRVTMSMREFLRTFFYMYYDDAAVLAGVLGFETGLEDTEYETFEEMIENKIESIELLKSAHKAEDVDVFLSKQTVEDYMSILSLQEQFEKAVRGGSKKPEKKTKPKASSSYDVSKSENKKGDISEMTIEELLKSKEVNELIEKAVASKAEEAEKVAQERVEKAEKQIEQLVKEKEDIRKAQYKELVEGYSFVQEDEREAVVETLMKSADGKVMELLEKAQKAISEFAEKQHGVGGEGDDSTEVEKGKSKVAEILKARKEKQA